MLPLVEKNCHHWMLSIVEKNMHQVGMLYIVDRECHSCMLHLVHINLHQGLPIFDSGDQGLHMVDSG